MNLRKVIKRPPPCPDDYFGNHDFEEIPVGTGYRRNDYGSLICDSFSVSQWIRACKNCSYCEPFIKPIGQRRKEFHKKK